MCTRETEDRWRVHPRTQCCITCGHCTVGHTKHWTCLFSLLSLCVGSFRPTSRRGAKDNVNNACLRDILTRSGCPHLVDACTWLIVAHRHARTSSNLCLSGKELRMLSTMFHVSLFLVTWAVSFFFRLLVLFFVPFFFVSFFFNFLCFFDSFFFRLFGVCTKSRS